MAELSEIFDVLELKREEYHEQQLQFLDFNDDFFSRSRNFKYCRFCKAHTTRTTGTVPHHALPSPSGTPRLCKYEEVQRWLDELVKYKDSMARMPEIQRHIKNILQLYHTSTSDLYPPVVWHFNRLFPGERLEEPHQEHEEEEQHQEQEKEQHQEHQEQEKEAHTDKQEEEVGGDFHVFPNPAFEDPSLVQVLDTIHVEYKVSFEFFLSWFDLFYMEEYLSSSAPYPNTSPSALLRDDLYFDDLGFISLSEKLKGAFGVDVDWQSLRGLTVAQVYSRNFR